MLVLVLNCGSSSIKFQLVETSEEAISNDEDVVRARGQVERLGSLSLIKFRFLDGSTVSDAVPLKDHESGIDFILRKLLKNSQKCGISHLEEIQAVGHRVVHGGEKFARSEQITPSVLRKIEECIELAPLHNPANLKGICAISAALGPSIPQVAVFDTSFHTTMDETAYLYPIPYQMYRRHKIRRYGFHGTSHRYVAFRYREFMDLPREKVNIISLHLGNGCSACAIEKGNSVDTSMGFTPLEGLMMGTRSGDIDPSILDFLAHKEGLSFQEIDNILNKQSGLLGISGLTNDMRELLEEEAENGDRRASLAISMFAHRVKKYIGAYLATMDTCDALVFTGGIGENAAPVRRRILSGLEHLGFAVDDALNNHSADNEVQRIPSNPSERSQADRQADNQETFTPPGLARKPSGARLISTSSSPRQILVIPTNEELFIARDTFRCVNDLPRRW
jgi:acetate kinase